MYCNKTNIPPTVVVVYSLVHEGISGMKPTYNFEGLKIDRPGVYVQWKVNK